MKNKNYTIGIHLGHDASVSLFKRDTLIYAEEEERLNKIKNYFGAPFKSLEYIFKNFEINPSDIQNVGISWDIKSYNINRQKYIDYAYANGYNIWAEKRKNYLIIKNKYLEELHQKLNHSNFYFISHHLSHALSTFPFQKNPKLVGTPAIICDAIAEDNSVTIYEDTISKKILFESNFLECSLGYFYQRWAEVLGFRGNQAPGYLMSLSGLKSDLNVNEIFYKEFVTSINGWKILRKENFIPIAGIEENASKCFKNTFLKKIKISSRLEENAHVAKGIQYVLEKIVISYANKVWQLTKSNNIILSGGVFHNCVLVKKIEDLKLFTTIYISPSSKDSGTSIGAGIGAILENTGNYYNSKASTPFLGFKINNIKGCLPIKDKYLSAYKITDIVMDLLKSKIVSIADGKLEFGPRSLGNRSIIALPNSKKISKKINSDIKKRYPFQPLAAVMLEEFAFDNFNIKNSEPFMSKVHHFNGTNYKSLSGVLHKDNSCRLQTVNSADKLIITQILNCLKDMGYPPVLINTSFNLKGQPLIRNQYDAILTYLKCDIDVLYCNNIRIAVPKRLKDIYVEIIENKYNETDT